MRFRAMVLCPEGISPVHTGHLPLTAFGAASERQSVRRVGIKPRNEGGGAAYHPALTLGMRRQRDEHADTQGFLERAARCA